MHVRRNKVAKFPGAHHYKSWRKAGDLRREGLGGVYIEACSRHVAVGSHLDGDRGPCA